tara:strand:- start:159 stop:698 length:540 start_codon:yes stop_codon:yes gene_type:complete
MAAVIKACIYRIDVCDEFYIGSTKDFQDRMGKHKQRSQESPLNLYKAIRANDGKFEMTKIYDFECYTETELLIEERAAYDKYKPTLNMVLPYRTEEETKLYHKEYRVKYNQENKEKQRLYQQKRKKENPEIVKAKQKIANKEYYHANKDKERERMRLYREKNKEKLSIARKAYYYKNKK